MNKKIRTLLLTCILSISMVGCSEFDSTKYLDETGKQSLEMTRKSDKEYVKIDKLNGIGFEYKNKYVVATGVVNDIPDIQDNTMTIWLDIECNNSQYPVRICIPKNMVDIEFTEGDTISVYGRFAGLIEKNKDNDNIGYFQINAYFLELGDTTNNQSTSKKKTKDNEIKEVTKNKSEDIKSKSKENKTEEKSTTSNNKAVTNNQKVDCAICGKKDYIDNMYITENHYECNNCVNKCPYCGKQMKEVYPSNWYCVNPNCYNCIDDYDRQRYNNPANPGDSTHTSVEDAGDYDPEPWDDPTNNSQWFGTD